MRLKDKVSIVVYAGAAGLVLEPTSGTQKERILEAINRFADSSNITLNSVDKDGTRVLIIDDDISLANFLMELLIQHNTPLQVEVVHDSFSAGRMMESFSPDIVLLDLMMPKMDGFEVCNMIKQGTHKNIQVIAMSGFCSPENVQHILSEGAECCLQKPFSTTTLLAALGLEKQHEHASK